jgi:hypothetical protein
MTEDDRNARAAEYIDRVIEFNRAHGGAVAMSPEQRQRTVAEAARLFRSLRPAGD